MEGNQTNDLGKVDESVNTIPAEDILDAAIGNPATLDGDLQVIPSEHSEQNPFTPEELESIETVSSDISFAAEKANEGNKAAITATLSTAFAAIEGQTSEENRTPQLFKRIYDYASAHGRQFIAAAVMGLALAPQAAEAEKFNFASITGGNLGIFGEILEKGRNLSLYEQQIKGVQGQIDNNVAEMNRLKDESKRAQLSLDIQMKGQNRQVGGEIYAQNKVYTAENKARLTGLEGEIKLENARFKRDHPSPDGVDIVEHDNRVQSIKSKIDILIANAEATRIRQDNTKAGVNTQGEFAGEIGRAHV